MKYLLLPLTLLFGLALAALAQTPNNHFPTPPPSMDPETQTQAPGDTPAPDWSGAGTERSRRSGAHRADQTGLRGQRPPGYAPKDVIEKLKQIEKLSKHLRAELNP